MIAVAWLWREAAHRQPSNLSGRLAASLCAGIGGHAGSSTIGDLHFAYRPLNAPPAISRSWRPAMLPSGKIVLFHGYFDNSARIAAELAVDGSNVAALYGLAVERWGDDAETRIIGEYCAVVIDPSNRHLRLSRSPLRAPPLFYYQSEDLIAVASVPRALFAAGAERILNEERVADSSLINFTDEEASWFKNIRRVPTGNVVELERGRPRVRRKPYDLFAVAPVRFKTDAEYMARASELLDEGVRACLTGFKMPGATLSGGLDSPQVALRVLSALPADQSLPTFTFHPEPGFDGIVDYGNMPDERKSVEELAAAHPRLEPHFTANEGYGHDHRWNDFFHLMGGAPSGLCNMYVFHGLFSAAAKRGCDVLLLAEWGNYTFSDIGNWGFVEYFLKGQWRQLWLALKRVPHDERPLWARFLVRSILPLLPTSAWRALRKIVKPNERYLLELMQPLSKDYRVSSGADERLLQSGILIDRYQPRSRREALKLIFRNGSAESGEIYQAFEQMYGVAQRDPTAYRPFVEFCAGLPTRMFLRDGVRRWLAKELAKGIVPEDQRANRLNGRWDSDWHLRIGRKRHEYLAELDRLEKDDRLSGMFDIPRLRAGLENWPEHTITDPQEYYGREFAVPRALLAARFIKWAEGSNQP